MTHDVNLSIGRFLKWRFQTDKLVRRPVEWPHQSATPLAKRSERRSVHRSLAPADRRTAYRHKVYLQFDLKLSSSDVLTERNGPAKSNAQKMCLPYPPQDFPPWFYMAKPLAPPEICYMAHIAPVMEV